MIDGEPGSDVTSIELSVYIRSSVPYTDSGIVIFAVDEFMSLLAGSEMCSLFKGVDSAGLTFQRPDRFKDRVAVEDSVARAEAGLGK